MEIQFVNEKTHSYGGAVLKKGQHFARREVNAA
jgi:hypothetical protein